MALVLGRARAERCVVGANRRRRRRCRAWPWNRAAARDGGSGRRFPDAQGRAHRGDDASRDARRAQRHPTATTRRTRTDGRSPDADPIAAASQAAYEVAANQYPKQRGAVAGASRSARGASSARAASSGSRRWARRLRAAQFSTIARATVGPARPSIAFIRWDPACTRNSASTAARRKASCSARAGRARQAVRAVAAAISFASAPPPAIDSEEYAAAFEEVKDVGASRAARALPIRLTWRCGGRSSWRLAQSPGARARARDRLELRRAARLFALLNMSIFDGYVSCSTASSSTTTGARTRRSTGQTKTAIRRTELGRAVGQPAPAHVRVSVVSVRARHGVRRGHDGDGGHVRRAAQVHDGDARGRQGRPDVRQDQRWIRRRAASRASRLPRWSARCRASTSASTSATTRWRATSSARNVGSYALKKFLSPVRGL